MVMQARHLVRPVIEKDRQGLSKLVEREAFMHQHLDWRSPLDWIGYKPYLLLEPAPVGPASFSTSTHPLAALACPQDPPGIAWIRVFAVSPQINENEIWQILWQVAQVQLTEDGFTGIVAAIPLYGWFQDILDRSEFCHTHDVVLLSWASTNIPARREVPAIRVRYMDFNDLPAVQSVDNAAFPTLWHYSRGTLELALQNAVLATVAEQDDQVIGYQISSATHIAGGHIARLAVLPEYQGLGIGYILVRDVLLQLTKRGFSEITVNTQHNNLASLALYDKIGFRRTREAYPVYEWTNK
jgi:ribosomal protein S18 acetylase RimI-like enzyme